MSKQLARRVLACLLVGLLAFVCTTQRVWAEPEDASGQEEVVETTAEELEATDDEESPAEPVADEGPEASDGADDADPADTADEQPVQDELAAGAPDGIDVFTLSADATEEVGARVTVDRSRTTVHISRVGTTGTAEVYAFAANEYPASDSMHGLSEMTAAKGTLIGTYTCGATQEFVFNRYTDEGEDTLYQKYYVVQGNTILVGPFYATNIASTRSVSRFEVGTKKGLIHEDSATPAMIQEMGASNTVINMDIGSLIYANEDKNGKPIDNSRRSDVIEFESNGETFYFNANEVKIHDGEISQYSKMGVNVTLVVIAWYNTDFGVYPTSLAYNTTDNHQTIAFNTSNERGLRYWVATMEFLADRYSRNSTYGLVDKFIIGNEIDYTYDWYLITPEKDANGKYQCAPFDTFMEEFARAFRLANLAVKKYNSEAKVTISLTHNWADARRDSQTPAATTGHRIYNSYAPKKILDWMNTVEKSRGDYDWSIAVHPYPIGTTSSNPLVSDFSGTIAGSGSGSKLKPVTGDWRTTPWITCSNLELYQQYLEQPEARYNGEVREVSLTETSICNVDKAKVSPEVYANAIRQQAATIAMYYYRAANLDCISEIAYFRAHDIEGTYKLGLMEVDDTKKPSYDMWKYVDTNLTFSLANRYLGSISDTATSYRELMDASNSGFDWDTKWSEENIIRRNVTTDVTRSLVTDLDSYEGDRAILVTATGSVGDRIGLYKATDDLNAVEPIYSYTIGTTSGNLTIRSNKTYSLVAYGDASASRTSEAILKAGEYVVALQRGDTGEFLTKEITITSDSKMGSTELSLNTDKDVYSTGENIVTTATGNTSCWVGLYKKGDVPGKITSIYWYYNNDPSAGIVSGKPFILQTGSHNSDSSNPGMTVAGGEYVVYLFDGSGGNDYNIVLSKEITVEAAPSIAPLESITYDLSDDTDGLANGMVTITKDEDNEDATNCVMYWADEEGNPLEGYTALAMFKLSGAVTRHEMYTHTVIPEGARKLIAYASDGSVLSDTAVSCDLPEGCTYHLDEPLAEFQIISDVHVTTDAGAKNEVRLSNQHFAQMLNDVKGNSPESLGIFINGDIANTGQDAEFRKVYNLYYKALEDGGRLPYIHMAIGNHDWMAGNPSKQFQRWCQTLNPDLDGAPDNVYYDEVVNGYHFIYLGGEQGGLHAVLSAEQLKWFDERLAEYTAEDPDKPIFVFLHQSMYNTVAGSLPGQGWDGVANESAFKRVLKKYGQIVLVNGHSHWELNSISCMYVGDDEVPVALNTAAVGYLWSSYNVIGGEFADGSHGYYVRVYDNKVVFLGRDFENNLWIPSAVFVLQQNKISVPTDSYTVPLGSEAVNLDATCVNGTGLNYLTTNPAIANVTADGTIIPRRLGTTDVVITAYGSDTLTMSRKRVKITVTDSSIVRVAGDNRYATSVKIAETLKQQLGVDKFDAVVLASGTNFPDALGGSYLASVKKAPILVTSDKGNTYQDINVFIRQNLKSGGTVYVLGGKLAVPDVCLTGLTNKFTIKRLDGKDRYDTNLKILKEAGVSSDQEILVATGTGYADTLSASASGRPILLVGKTLRADQKSYLTSHKANPVRIVGGEMAVAKGVESEIKGNGNSVVRTFGSNRYETSVAIARELFPTPSRMVLAYAMNYPDALCGGPLACKLGCPLILTKEGSHNTALKYATDNGITGGYVLGGPLVLSDGVVKVVFQSTKTIDVA